MISKEIVLVNDSGKYVSNNNPIEFTTNELDALKMSYPKAKKLKDTNLNLNLSIRYFGGV